MWVKIRIFDIIVIMKLLSIKLDKLSDIAIAIGQVFFASAFIEPIVSKQSSISTIVLAIFAIKNK